MVLDGYVRVSRVGKRDGESFISPEVQEARIRAWASEHGHRIDRVHTDLDRSGGTLDRHGVQQALERVETGAVDGLVVADLDRFGRSIIDTHTSLERIKKAGGAFIAVRQGIDTSVRGTWADNFVLRSFANVAQMERERIADNWSVARSRAIARGAVPFRAPFGYSKDESKRLVPNADAPLVAEVFRRRVEGESWMELAHFLNIHQTTRVTQWQTATVRRLVQNETYLGVARHGEFVNPDAHEAIVDRATWTAAQQARGMVPQRNHDHPPLLSGLVRCAGCRYTAKRAKGKGRAGQMLAYRCKANHGAGRCPEPMSMSESKLDAYVQDEVMRRFEDATLTLSRDGTDRAYKDAEAAVATAEAELAAWRDDTDLRAILDRDTYLDGFRTRTAAVDAARQARDEAASTAGVAQQVVAALGEEYENGTLWDFLDANVEVKAWVIRSLVDAVFVTRDGQRPAEERVTIAWRGQAPADLPRRGKAPGPIRPFDPSDLGEAQAVEAEQRVGRMRRAVTHPPR